MNKTGIPTKFIAVFLARGTAALGGLALSVIIARLNGISEIGAFAFALTIIHFSMILSRYGYDMVLMRNVAQIGQGDFIPILRKYLVRITLTSLLVMLGVLFICSLAGLAPNRMEILQRLFLGLPLLTGISLFSGYLKGAGKPAIAALCETGGLAGLTAATLGVIYFSIGPLSIISISLIYSSICLLVFSGLFYLVWRMEQNSQSQISQPSEFKEDGAKSFWIVANAVYLSQTGALIIAGSILTDSDIGHIRIAERLALIAGFALTVTNPIVARHFAHDHKNHKFLKRHFIMASAFATIFALAIGLTIAIFNGWLLDQISGYSKVGRDLLFIYLAGSVFNAMTGTSSMLLSMTGNEKFLMRTVVMTFLLAMPSYYLGGLAGGVMGFAIAYLLILVLKNSVIFFRVLQILYRPDANMDPDRKTG